MGPEYLCPPAAPASAGALHGAGHGPGYGTKDPPSSLDLTFDPLYASDAGLIIMALTPALAFAPRLTSSLKYTECLPAPRGPFTQSMHPPP